MNVIDSVLRSFSAVFPPVPNGMVKDEPEITFKMISKPRLDLSRMFLSD